MPIFESLDDVADLKTYVTNLKKALGHVKPGAEKDFVYYKDFEISNKTIPFVVVNVAPKCVTLLKSKFGTPTAAGTVSRTPQDELDFDIDKGSLKPKVLKKYFATLGGLPDVLVNPNDDGSDSDDDIQTRPRAARGQPLRPAALGPAPVATPPAQPVAPGTVPPVTGAAPTTVPSQIQPGTAPSNPTAPDTDDDDIETRPRAARGQPPRPAALGPAPVAPPPAQPPVQGVAPVPAPTVTSGAPTNTTTTTATTTTVPPPPAVQPAPPGTVASTASTASTSSTATTPPRAHPVAAAPAAPPPPANVGIPLPANEGEQATLVYDYIKALRGTDLPVKDPHKTQALDKAQEHADNDRYAEALKLLNVLVKNVSYPGVAEWALQPASRKYEVELLTEQLFAMTNLIKSKRKKSSDWSKEEGQIMAVINRITGVSTGLKTALLTADPPKVKAAFDLWQPLVDEKQRLAVRSRTSGKRTRPSASGRRPRRTKTIPTSKWRKPTGSTRCWNSRKWPRSKPSNTRKTTLKTIWPKAIGIRSSTWPSSPRSTATRPPITRPSPRCSATRLRKPPRNNRTWPPTRRNSPTTSRPPSRGSRSCPSTKAARSSAAPSRCGPTRSRRSPPPASMSSKAS